MSDIVLGDLVAWAAAVITLVTLASVVWNLFSGPARRNGVLLADTRKDVIDQRRRLDAAEVRLSEMPSKDTIHRLDLVMAEQNRQLTELRGEVLKGTAIMERLEETLKTHDNRLQKLRMEKPA